MMKYAYEIVDVESGNIDAVLTEEEYRLYQLSTELLEALCGLRDAVYNKRDLLAARLFAEKTIARAKSG